MNNQKTISGHGMSSFSKLNKKSVNQVNYGSSVNAVMMTLKLKIFLIPWKILLLNFFSRPCCTEIDLEVSVLKNFLEH